MGNCLLTKSNELRFNLLWTNPSPSASFSSQTISLNLNTYKLVFIGTDRNPPILPINSNTYYINYEYSGRQIVERSTQAKTSGVVFGNATFDGSTSNGYLIPKHIYGIK